MAVNIKTELSINTECMNLCSPLTVGVNAMDDEKQQNFLHQAMLKKERQMSMEDNLGCSQMIKKEDKIDTHSCIQNVCT